MIRHFAESTAVTSAVTAAAVAALMLSAVPASAEPVAPDSGTILENEVYAIGMCYDPAHPLPQRPEVFDYNCDKTGVLQDMTWTEWGPDGARGTGTDNAIECQPNCAEGRRLLNPVVVHAWNPQPSESPTCPANARFYSDLTIAYPHEAPPWIAPGSEWAPGTDFTTVDGMPAVHFSGLTSRCEDQLR